MLRVSILMSVAVLLIVVGGCSGPQAKNVERAPSVSVENPLPRDEGVISQQSAIELANKFVGISDRIKFQGITERGDEWFISYLMLDAQADPNYRIVRVKKATGKCRWGFAK